MSNETYPQEMTSGATFTGSHVHVIDYDRAGLADFLSNNAPAASISSKARATSTTASSTSSATKCCRRTEGGVWGNQTLPDGTVSITRRRCS
jgi:hypothetical protein